MTPDSDLLDGRRVVVVRRVFQLFMLRYVGLTFVGRAAGIPQHVGVSILIHRCHGGNILGVVCVGPLWCTGRT